MKVFLLFLLINSLYLSTKAQDLQRVRGVIDTLCAPNMQGRGYVKQGDKIAANFIKEKYKAIGLISFQEDYFQYFTFDGNTFPKKVSLSLNHKKIKVGEEFIINASSKAGKGNLKAIYLDSVTLDKNENYKHFLEKNIKKHALVYEKKYTKTLKSLPKEVIAKIEEAKAIIEIQENDKLTASVATEATHNPIFEVQKSSISAKIEQVKFKVDAKLLTQYKSQNIIGYIKGNVQPDSFIVITAHYDHLGKMGQTVYFPGANDNASGISMLLELAHYYKKPQNIPPYSIVFIAFSAEELGLLGSAYYVKHPLFPLTQMKFLINLDLVGTGNEGISIVNATLFEKEYQKLAQINSEKKYFNYIQKRGTAANSDHYYFSQQGVKAFFIYTLGGIKAYHDVHDVAKTLPLAKYTELFNLLTDFIKEIN